MHFKGRLQLAGGPLGGYKFFSRCSMSHAKSLAIFSQQGSEQRTWYAGGMLSWKLQGRWRPRRSTGSMLQPSRVTCRLAPASCKRYAPPYSGLLPAFQLGQYKRLLHANPTQQKYMHCSLMLA